MWEFISEILFGFLPPKVQFGCMAIVALVLGCVLLWAWLS